MESCVGLALRKPRLDAEPGPEPDPDTRTHFRVCRFITETACTVYHRFFQCCSPRVFEPHLVAMAAIYLAGKVEEQHLRTRDIINVCHRYLNPGSDPLELDSRFWDLRDSIVQCELLLLRVLNFQVSFQHPHKVNRAEQSIPTLQSQAQHSTAQHSIPCPSPAHRSTPYPSTALPSIAQDTQLHKYLLHYLLSLKALMNRHAWDRTPIAVTTWALLRDSYHGSLCHPPQHVAVAVLYLALQTLGVEVPGEGEREWWQARGGEGVVKQEGVVNECVVREVLWFNSDLLFCSSPPLPLCSSLVQVLSDDITKLAIDDIIAELIQIYNMDAKCTS